MTLRCFRVNVDIGNFTLPNLLVSTYFMRGLHQQRSLLRSRVYFSSIASKPLHLRGRLGRLDPTPVKLQLVRPQFRTFSQQDLKMSFSNTDTGDKPADPYKMTNAEAVDLVTKLDDLVSFMEAQKFGMLTTRIASSGLLTSRAMGLAAKVRLSAEYFSKISLQGWHWTSNPHPYVRECPCNQPAPCITGL